MVEFPVNPQRFDPYKQLVLAFKVFRCWPSEYVALSDLDAMNTSVAFESITLQNEGWERDETYRNRQSLDQAIYPKSAGGEGDVAVV